MDFCFLKEVGEIDRTLDRPEVAPQGAAAIGRDGRAGEEVAVGCSAARNAMIWAMSRMAGRALGIGAGEGGACGFRIDREAAAIDKTGREAVDAMPMGRPFDRGGAGHILDAGARGGAVRDARHAAAVGGRDIDNDTTLPPSIHRRATACVVSQHPVNCVYDGPPALGRDLRRALRELAAGIVDEDIRQAETRRYGVQQPFYPGLVANIAGVGEDGPTTRVEGGLHRFEPFGVAPANRNPCTETRQHPCRRFAESRCPPDAMAVRPSSRPDASASEHRPAEDHRRCTRAHLSSSPAMMSLRTSVVPAPISSGSVARKAG